jgi:hypothetical protein
MKTPSGCLSWMLHDPEASHERAQCVPGAPLTTYTGKELNKLAQIVEARKDEIERAWHEHFGN